MRVTSQRFNRRQFLSLTAAMAAGAAVVACGGTPATTPTAPAATVGAGGSAAPSAAPSVAPATRPAGSAAPSAAAISVNGGNATPSGGAATPSAAANKNYKDSPYLATQVSGGKIPAVAQRLPSNPRVLTPLQEVGQFGGTWRGAYRGLSDRVGPTKQIEENFIRWSAPDPTTIKLVANVPEKWETNADASEYTFYLRQGMK